MTSIIVFLLCFLSGLLNSTEDLIKDKWYQSIFRNFKHVWFWQDSWKNKYVDRDPKLGRVKINLILFKIVKPVQLTDWWHFSKMLNLTFLFLAMLFCLNLEFDFWGVITVVIAGLLRNVGFVLGYENIFFTEKKIKL